MVKKTVLSALALLVFLGLAAGGGFYYYENINPPDLTPGQVIEQYFAAVQKGDYQKAYQMVSRQHYHDSFNQFIDRVSMYSPEMTLQVQGETIDNNKAVVNLHIFIPLEFGPYSSNTSMDLIREKREWKIVCP
ncbi:hypothetical protein SPACI_052580 [Sporomusa acidovorans DSM 3132]|uniref:Lumazine-binding domain protein n=2 Tax=Sporomusa TaxID=2375 RepID=A0ABZ3J9V5_SPOA4|nr:hypothetical protein [Sporomusa acidovorans]OZC21782.1 lumazine-binding domain protein [Sporomusa acidovorans DSM 3132]SDD56982.1 hypothetical protein SAMN04488499_100276 [Sporomusa acidovorans]